MSFKKEIVRIIESSSNREECKIEEQQHNL